VFCDMMVCIYDASAPAPAVASYGGYITANSHNGTSIVHDSELMRHQMAA
jgi:hypothetical protein